MLDIDEIKILLRRNNVITHAEYQVQTLGYPKDHPYFSALTDVFVMGYYSGFDKMLDIVHNEVTNETKS